MVALIQYGYVLVEGNMGHKDMCTGPQHMRMETEIRLTSTSGRGVGGRTKLPKSRGQPWNRVSLMILGIFSVSVVMPPPVRNFVNLDHLSQPFN